MDLITPHDLRSVIKFPPFVPDEPILKLVYRLLDLHKVNHVYKSAAPLDGLAFIDKVLQEVDLSYSVTSNDLSNIPTSGSFITVANHPFGAIEGLMLMKIFGTIRHDYKMLANFLLKRVVPVSSYILEVNPFENHKEIHSSLSGLKTGIIHLQNGGCMGIFPAGEVSSFRFSKMRVTDIEWRSSMVRFIRKANVPVIPVYIDGRNSILFNLLGLLHPSLRTLRLASEQFNKKGKKICIRIGAPIEVNEQNNLRKLDDFGQFIRMKSYCMGIKPTSPIIPTDNACQLPKPVEPSLDYDNLLAEVNSLKPVHLLFQVKEFLIFAAPPKTIPHLMHEIGRLRELTFREVGEGTNKALDLDSYDTYYEQLIIWDDELKKIVGGYRFCKGDIAIQQLGLKGLYINSLFKISPVFKPVLEVSIELGRSFIVQEYQRKPLPLFLLWKGILYILLHNPGYRFLIGPVSIPNEMNDLSKSITVDFLKDNYAHQTFSGYIKPRLAYVPKRKLDSAEVFLKYVKRDVKKLEKFIRDMQPDFKLPVLLKKYLSVNAEVLGFNVDPMFSNCLDALIILDLFDIPKEMIEGLAKEINQNSLTQRFQKGNRVVSNVD